MRRGLFSAEPEWDSLANLGPNHGTALDVGANCGYYSYALAELYGHVIAFEPNASTTKELEACRLPNVDLRHLGLSDQAGPATLYIPKSKEAGLLTGWASFDRENLQERIGEIEVSVQTASLDGLRLEGVTFVKMDVEGHEVSVLRGAEQFLRTNRPTILIEVRPSTVEEVISLLAKAGLTETPATACRSSKDFSVMRLFVPAPNWTG